MIGGRYDPFFRHADSANFGKCGICGIGVVTEAGVSYSYQIFLMASTGLSLTAL